MSNKVTRFDLDSFETPKKLSTVSPLSLDTNNKPKSFPNVFLHDALIESLEKVYQESINGLDPSECNTKSAKLSTPRSRPQLDFSDYRDIQCSLTRSSQPMLFDSRHLVTESEIDQNTPKLYLKTPQIRPVDIANIPSENDDEEPSDPNDSLISLIEAFESLSLDPH